MDKGNLGKIAAIGFSLFLLLAMELGSRFLVEKCFSSSPLLSIQKILLRDPARLWRQRPLLNTRFFGAAVITDESGFRANPDEISKITPNDFKIAILGASPSFGWGVNREATYGAQLEALAHHRGMARVKAINLSQIGYSSFQGRELLKGEIRRLRPNLVLVSFGINDVTKERFYYSGKREDKEVRVVNAEALNTLSETGLFQLISALLGKLAPAGGLEKNTVVRVSEEDYIRNHFALADLASSYGAKTVFLTIPFHFPATGSPQEKLREMYAAEGRFFRYSRDLKESAAKAKIPLIDLYDFLYAHYKSYYLIDKNDYIHPNGAGHAMIARVVFDRLQKERLLP